MEPGARHWFLAHGIVTERLADDRQRVRLHPEQAPTGALACSRDRSPAHAALHAAHQRQGRALPADAATRMGLRARIRLKRRPVGPRCHTGCATTTSGAPTAPSATALPSTAFGRSPGSTASTDGAARDAVDLGALKGNRGNQQYRLPGGAKGGSTVVVWCRAFSAAFGSARLRPA